MDEHGSGVIDFCVLYVFAAYIRKYVPVHTINAKGALITYIVCMLITVGERALSTLHIRYSHADQPVLLL